MEEKQSRTRRTKEQLESDINAAIERLVEKRGFVDIPVTAIISEANIDPNAFYRRHKGVPEVYEEIARKYDFWINDSVRISDLAVMGDKAFLINNLSNLFIELSDNKIMQKLLIWELTDINKTTKHTSQLRDTLHHTLLSYYGNSLKESGLNTNCVLAILIGGIYYLVLHRGISTFCLIDFTTEQSKKEIRETIAHIVDLLYQKQEYEQKKAAGLNDAIEKMLADRISKKKICHYLNITMDDLKDY